MKANNIKNFFLVPIIFACLLLAPVMTFAVDKISLKRLFYSEAERKVINRLRNASTIKATNTDIQNDSSEMKKKNNTTVIIDGFIKREDGENVVWFNNTSTIQENSVSKNTKIRAKFIDNTGVNIVSDKKILYLKPGQVLEISSGKVKENYTLKDTTAKMEIIEEK